MIYLTPASIGYMNQVLLSLLITTYLVWRRYTRRGSPSQRLDLWLVLFMGSVAAFSLLFFLEASLPPETRLVAVYLQNTTLAFLLVMLIQFAYHFPRQERSQNVERYLALAVSGIYFFVEASIAIWRFSRLAEGDVIFRQEFLDFGPIILFAWTIVIFLRKTVRHWQDRVSRWFAWVFAIPLVLAVLNVLRSLIEFPADIYNIAMSIGLLVTIFLFAFLFLVSQKEYISLMVKFTGAMLTAVLAFAGMLPWLVVPAYVAHYEPNICDTCTLFFVPNEGGGYDVRNNAYRPVTERGDKVELTDIEWYDAPLEIDFDFVFYEQKYTRLTLSKDGAIGMGSELYWKDFQFHFGRVPAIFAILASLDVEDSPDGAVYLLQEEERLVVTFERIRGFKHPEQEYSFQIVLHSQGNFEISVSGMHRLAFFPDDVPEGTFWVIGAKPEKAAPVNYDFRTAFVQTDSGGALHNEYMNFRAYLHKFVSPLAAAIFGGGLFFLVFFPLMVYYGMGRPLKALMQGVQKLHLDKTNIQVPVQSEDEIGYLAKSFSQLQGDLEDLIRTLEARVEERTEELQESEKQYRDLFEMESDAIFIIRNSDSRILEANSAASALYGYTREELLAMKNTDLSAEPEQTRQATQATLPINKIITIPSRLHRKKDGKVIVVEITARFFTWRGQAVHIAAIRDITERKKMEEARLEAELRHRSLFEQTHDAVFILDLEGRHLEANQRAAELLGYKREELLGLSVRDTSAQPDESQDVIGQLLSGEHIPTYERIFKRKDGSHVPVEINVELVRDSEGNPLHIQSVVRDITERKQAQAKLENLAITDPLTGLNNRRHFFNEAEKIFGRSLHPPYELCLLMIDIDRFKLVNDTYGHLAGDAVLREVSRRLQMGLRPNDLLARVGGEEFMIMLPRTKIAEACQIGRRLLEGVFSPPISFADLEITVSLSIGVSVIDAQTNSLDELIHHADQALYLAKRERNQLVCIPACN